MNITPVYLDAFSQVWPLAKPILKRAVDKYPFVSDIELLEEELFNGELLLWIMSDEEGVQAACTTRIVEHPTGNKECQMPHMAGAKLDEWVWDWVKLVETYAREQGCQIISGQGRRGWERLGKRIGLEYYNTTLVKFLGD